MARQEERHLAWPNEKSKEVWSCKQTSRVAFVGSAANRARAVIQVCYCAPLETTTQKFDYKISIREGTQLAVTSQRGDVQ